ncbi:DUF1772 domain-containing protein [Nocardioides mesophilus]|uniref:DUF1772 domain-containing protein n=1 Tax=Nocardioides mesophilus TaxID=433659 RepID=A0A7G9RFK0_9ACTN|nr:DUF1772 domain-containing protein [Nocardioides mesophilus]QNN54375.1 DUF1772 domain-containing protein [Nocardioides mesophilus]
MSNPDASLLALAVATALHAGFQLTVTVLVYPALARVEPEHWRRNHDAHSRLITPLVVLVYGALVLAGGWALLEDAGDPWVWACLSAVVVTFAVTAVLAAPTHGRLSAGKDEALVRRLLLADRVRAAAAAVACVAAVLAAW